MNRDPYNEDVRELFFNPRHVGDVADGAIAYFADQGLRIRLSAEIADADMTKLRFRAWGCPHVIAASEWFCREFQGRPVSDLDEFETGPIMQQLAVPVEKTGRILVLEDTVRSLGQAIDDRCSSDRQD